MNIKKLLFCFFLLAIMNVGLAEAESKEADLYYNDEPQSIMISILYEHDDVSIEIIDPSGNIVSLDSDTVVYFSDETSMLIIIRDAAEGQWKINYDKGSNEYIEYYACAYEEPIWITSLEVGDIDDDSMDLSFMVSAEEEISISYTVYLGTNESMSTKREIGSGRAKTNTEVDTTVSLDGVNTYDSYYLSVYAYYTKDGTEYFDEAVTGPFSYRNSETKDGVEDFYVEINKSLDTILVSLEDYMPYSAEGAYITVYEDGNEIISEYVSSDSPMAQAGLSEGASQIECVVTVRYSSGLVSDETVKKFEISGDDAFTLTLPESGISNNYRYEFEYANASNQSVFFTINDGKPEETVLNGSGRKYTILEEVQNTICVEYYNSEGVLFIYEESMAVDTIPPALTLYEDLDGITVSDDTVIIAGKTDTNSVLTINDEAVELSDRGVFDYVYSLTDGVNTITINAADDVGNITTYAFKIYKSSTALAVGNVTDNPILNRILEYVPLIIALFASAFGITVLLIAGGGKKKKRRAYVTLRKEAVAVLVYSILGEICSAAVYFLRRRFEKSADYIELSVDFPKEAYAYLQNTKLVLLTVAVFAGLILLSVIVILITNAVGKRAKKKALRKEAAAAKKAVAETGGKPYSEPEAEAKVEAEAETAAKAEVKAEAETEEEAKAEVKAEAETEEEAEAEVKAEAEVEEGAEAEAEQATPEKEIETELRAEKESEAGPEPEYKFCRYCGTRMKLKSNFCGKCGKKQ